MRKYETNKSTYDSWKQRNIACHVVQNILHNMTSKRRNRNDRESDHPGRPHPTWWPSRGTPPTPSCAGVTIRSSHPDYSGAQPSLSSNDVLFIISITVVVVVVITEVRNLEEKSEVGWKKAGITTFWIRNVARILIRFCSQCAGKHFRTKLMSLYIDQKNWFDERIQELISKVQNPGFHLGKKNFV